MYNLIKAPIKAKSLLAFVLMSLLFISACSEAEDEKKLLETSPLVSDAALKTSTDAERIVKMTAPELVKELHNGELSAVQVTHVFLDRIEAIDKNGPRLNSVIEINPDALKIAMALDNKYAKDAELGSLHGVPVLLKANIDTGDDMATSAGSLALANFYVTEDAPVVANLRAAGAVILGKTNLSEWANFRSEHSVSGWSSLGGQTLNPHVLDRNPCGSSSGSAVAVAAYLTPLAVGTETDGSVVCPSGVNGVVGIKPTVGRVNAQGIIPISATQDTAGPMARTVAGAALLYEAMHGIKFEAPLAPVKMQGLRVGVWRNYYGADTNPRITAIFDASIETLKTQGAIIVDPIEFPDRSAMNDAEYEVLLYEFKEGLNKYFLSKNDDSTLHALESLIAFNQENADKVMPYFQQEIFVKAQAKGDLNDAEYITALGASHIEAQGLLNKIFKQHDVDVIIAPTNQAAWKIDYLNGDRFLLSSSGPSAVSGYPNVTVPMGDIMGLPIGLSFIGLENEDEKLIGIAAEFEALTQARIEPAFVPSLEVR